MNDALALAFMLVLFLGIFAWMHYCMRQGIHFAYVFIGITLIFLASHVIAIVGDAYATPVVIPDCIVLKELT